MMTMKFENKETKIHEPALFEIIIQLQHITVKNPLFYQTDISKIVLLKNLTSIDFKKLRPLCN